MNHAYEMPFRIGLAFLFALFTCTGWYFQDFIQRSQRLTVKHEIREVFFFLLNGLVWIPILLYILTTWLDFAHLSISAWLRWVGSLILIFGNAGYIWSHRTLGRNWSGILEIRQGHTLVTDGPYRYVRHPMYSAILLVGMGVSLLSANWLVAVTYLGIFSVIILVRIPSEEEMMLEQFGDAYREYKQKTGCLLPRLRHGKAE